MPGSGKSSTARATARILGYEHFSSGDLFRKMAEKRGLSVEELNFTAEKQKEIDREVDELLKQIGNEKNNLVIDSRMAFHWIPRSFKVFLDLDLNVAIQRTFANIQKDGRTSQSGSSIEEVRENTLKRISSEQKRYMSLYGIDVTDKSQFDAVVNTEDSSIEEVANIVADKYKEWLKSDQDK